MDWHPVYNELKEWQTALTGLAAISAALMAYRFSKKRDSDLRNQQALSTACALYGELLALETDINVTAHVLLHFLEEKKSLFKKQVGLFIPTRAMIWESHINKLGILDPNLITSLTLFYQKVDEVRRALLHAGEASDFDTSHILEAHKIAARYCIQALKRAQDLRLDLEKIVGYSHDRKSNFPELVERSKAIDESIY